MKDIIQYRCGVDTRGPYKFRHNTQGVYQVAAKSVKEAKRLLQETIGFGSITYIYAIDDKQCRNSFDFDGIVDKPIRLPYKMVKKINIGATEYGLSNINLEPHHANAPTFTWDNGH